MFIFSLASMLGWQTYIVVPNFMCEWFESELRLSTESSLQLQVICFWKKKGERLSPDSLAAFLAETTCS